MKKNQVIFAFTLLPFLSGTYQASAALVDVPAITFGSTPYPEEVNLPLFNSSMGTLTGVTITLTSTDTLESDVINIGPAASYTGATATGVTSLTGLPGVNNFSVSIATTPANGSIAGGSLSSPVTVVAGSSPDVTQSQQFNLSSADISSYEYNGTGSQDMMFGVTFQGLYSGGVVGNSEGVFFGGSSSANGMVQVVYAYTPTAVPEAATLWAAIPALGIGGFGLCGRLRRSARVCP